MTTIKCISVSPEFEQLAKENHLSWSKAATIGMAILLGDAGVREYDNNLNLCRKMRIFQKTAEEASRALDELKKRYNITEGVLNVTDLTA